MMVAILRLDAGTCGVQGDGAEEVDGLGIAEIDDLEQGEEAEDLDSSDLLGCHEVLLEQPRCRLFGKDADGFGGNAHLVLLCPGSVCLVNTVGEEFLWQVVETGVGNESAEQGVVLCR